MNKRFLPLIVFGLIAVLCALPLLKKSDPRILPSAMIGKPVPDFKLDGLSVRDFKGHVTIVNFFASWCVPCAAEQEVLAKISRAEKIMLYGVAYKDKGPEVKRFLARYGNPFKKLAHDVDGRASIEWGVYGVPETFVIGRDGIILYRHAGAVTPDDYKNIIRPLLKEAQK